MSTRGVRTKDKGLFSRETTQNQHGTKRIEQRTVHKTNKTPESSDQQLRKQVAKRKQQCLRKQLTKRQKPFTRQSAYRDAQVDTRTSVVQIEENRRPTNTESRCGRTEDMYLTVPNRNKNKRLRNMRSEGKKSPGPKQREVGRRGMGP